MHEISRLIGKLARPKRLNTVVFFVTSTCNEKCRHCFYWAELNQKGDLTFEEIKKISSTMPPITDLWLSGGEPFMRKELPAILAMFYRVNGVRSMNLPTNGLFLERTHHWLEQILMECGDLCLDLNVSLDGFEDTHEKLRGVPGCYRKTTDFIRSLPPLVQRFRRQLRVNVNTCLNADNANEMVRFMQSVYRELPVDGQYLQLIRGNPKDPSLKPIPSELLREIYQSARALYEQYALRLFKNLGPLSRASAKAIYAGTLAFHNKIQYANYLQSSPWPMPCTAGETFCVIDYNGDVRACELRGRIANLRDYDFDFSAFWQDWSRPDEVRKIACDQCFCTHVCNIHDSLRYSPKVMAVDIPLTYWSTRPRGREHRA